LVDVFLIDLLIDFDLLAVMNAVFYSSRSRKWLPYMLMMTSLKTSLKRFSHCSISISWQVRVLMTQQQFPYRGL